MTSSFDLGTFWAQINKWSFEDKSSFKLNFEWKKKIEVKENEWMFPWLGLIVQKSSDKKTQLVFVTK